LKRGIVLNEVLKQEQFKPWSMEEQVIILYVATTDRMNFLAKEDIKEYYSGFIDSMWLSHADIMERIAQTGVFDDKTKGEVDQALDDYNSTFLTEHTEYNEDD
ncbi:MAG: hypothetical protein IJ869_06605, partial [Clostridiales bacterium]|nr:hypothetical protein [Clostridiales bacterium]